MLCCVVCTDNMQRCMLDFVALQATHVGTCECMMLTCVPPVAAPSAGMPVANPLAPQQQQLLHLQQQQLTASCW